MPDAWSRSRLRLCFSKQFFNRTLDAGNRDAVAAFTVQVTGFAQTGGTVHRRLEADVSVTGRTVALAVGHPKEGNRRRPDCGSNMNRTGIGSDDQPSLGKQGNQLLHRAARPDDRSAPTSLIYALCAKFFNIIP